MTERLTTLSAVKQWLKIDTDGSDELLIRGIDSASRFILGWLGRDSISGRNYIQNCTGTGSGSMMLRNWPVISVSSVGIAGASIPGSILGTAGMPGSGWTLSDPRMAAQFINLYGHLFYYRAPCQIVYRAGYEGTESFVIPTVANDVPFVLVTPNNLGQWVEDEGVEINGVAAVKVAASPTTGQYAVSEWGEYSFAKADSGKTAIIAYGYAPWDLADAVAQMVGLWFKRADRIGIQSKSLSGGVSESVTFSTANMDDAVKQVLQLYQNVV